jgi:hypothetical protein
MDGMKLIDHWMSARTDGRTMPKQYPPIYRQVIIKLMLNERLAILIITLIITNEITENSIKAGSDYP